MNKKVLHISTECFPAAKAGGMADVVGALPNYQSDQGWDASVIIPRYDLPWFHKNEFKVVHEGVLSMEFVSYPFTILQYQGTALAYDFYCVDIPQLYARSSIYLNEHGHGYGDEAERNMALQRSTLQWLSHSHGLSFDLIHCHDHQAALVPFMMKHCKEYQRLQKIPTFYTIHNGEYNSRYPWSRRFLLPEFPPERTSTLDWDHGIDAVSAAMRYADHINAVSPTYIEELKYSLGPLRMIMAGQPDKFSGILNGIDEKLWDPKKDNYLQHKLGRSWDSFKVKNKQNLLTGLYRTEDVPLISFIGRFAYQKGGDLLSPSIERILGRFGFVNFFILGSGDKDLERNIQSLRDRYPERVACYIGYNEGVAHMVYAASDFILMPSRFEPCGLNQMFAMRYGTIPVARQTGGLKDTVVDFQAGGTGVSFTHDSVDDLTHAMSRALYLYKDKEQFVEVRDRGIACDYSWNKSAKIYSDIYNKLTA